PFTRPTWSAMRVGVAVLLVELIASSSVRCCRAGSGIRAAVASAEMPVDLLVAALPRHFMCQRPLVRRASRCRRRSFECVPGHGSGVTSGRDVQEVGREPDELIARADLELPEDLPEVVLDRPWTDE